MIRNHPDALAILAILILVPAIWTVENIGYGVRWNVPDFRRDFQVERQRVESEREQFRLERDRFREELHRAFRFRGI